MMSHSQLQNYKHEYAKVCMTGVLGCRWHRYKQSKNGSNTKDLICFTFLLLTSLFVVFWFYSILAIKNDRYTLNEFMYGHVETWVSWYTILLAVICVLFSYVIILLILSFCHIVQGHQLFIHPVHLVVVVVILAVCIGLTIVIEDLWRDEFHVIYLSLLMFGPFLQIGAVCFMTLLSWTISQEWNRISKFSRRVVYLCLFFCLMAGLYVSPLFIDCPCILLSENLPKKPKLVAHRGASSIAPENTVIAFKKAAAYNHVAGLECDVMISAGDDDGSNGTLFVMHDQTLWRTTNIADVYPDLVDSHPSNLNISQLRNLDAGSWFVKADPFGTLSSIPSSEQDLFARQQIPLFSEVLEIAKNTSKFLIIDLKYPPAGHRHSNDTDQHLIEAMKQSGIDHSQLLWLGSNDPSILTENYTMIYGGRQDTIYLVENNYTGVNLLNGAAGLNLLREYGHYNLSTLLYLVNTGWLYSFYWCLGVTHTHSDYIQDLDNMDAPLWQLAPHLYRALWITVDTLSALTITVIFIVHRCRLFKIKYGPEQVSLNSASTNNSWGRRHSRRSMKEKLILKDVPMNIYDFEPDEDIGISSNGYDATVNLEDGRVLAEEFQRNRASYHSNMSEGNSVISSNDGNRNSYIEGLPSENGDAYHSNRSSYHSNLYQTEAEIA